MSEQPVPSATHTMSLAHTYPSGAEEWQCQACGRSFIIQWPPQYKKIVLNPGDENVPHAGGKGGLAMGSMSMSPSDEESPLDALAQGPEGDSDDTPFDDSSLGPWLKWFRESGIKDDDA